MTKGVDSLVGIGHRRALVPATGWVTSFIGTCSNLSALAREHAAGAGLSRGCVHNRDDETLFSTGPSKPPRCLDWHRTSHCGSGNRFRERRRRAAVGPQPTGQQRAQGLGEVRMRVWNGSEQRNINTGQRPRRWIWKPATTNQQRAIALAR